MSDNNTSSGGIGTLGMMFIALFVGKIFAIDPVATWSWWIITAPLWGIPALILGFVAVCFCFAFTASLFFDKKNGNP